MRSSPMSSMENLYTSVSTKVSASLGFEIEPERERPWYEKLEAEVCGQCPSMTWSQRIWGCMICMICGFFISMGSMFNFTKLLAGNPIPFACQYTAGNILSLSSTCFLYGPLAQAKSMFATTRLVTTIIYFTMMGATLFLAFFPDEIPGRVFLLIAAIFLQSLALLWYTLSFIPFARDLAKNCIVGMCCNCVDGEDESFWGF